VLPVTWASSGEAITARTPVAAPASMICLRDNCIWKPSPVTIEDVGKLRFFLNDPATVPDSSRPASPAVRRIVREQ
jgi:hypothetical protein